MSSPATWDFGLSEEQEARAAQLHQDSIIVDMMNQHPGGMNIFRELDPRLVEQALGDIDEGLSGVGHAILAPYRIAATGQSDLIEQWWRQSGVDVGVFGVGMGPPHVTSAMSGYRELYDVIWSLEWTRKVTTAADIRQAKAEGDIAFYGYCQPVYGLSANLDDVDAAYEQGLRVLMLTYNRQDYVGAGCTEPNNAGLSRYGEQVVERCNDLGIIVDTSHCGKQTTLDACRLSTTPVFANHACAQGVYGHARGKSDEEIDAIAATGGVVGVVTVPFFLSPDAEPSVEVVLDHIDYIAERVGPEHVGIGTDWPMQAPEDVIQATLGAIVDEIGFREEDNISTTKTLVGFEDYRDMPNITRGLVARGYADDDIRGILGENFLRVYEAVAG
ncbi:MAG: membrane dipeptidase [Kiritimatiellia bacterium]|jgi:membrane dipeptidase|nr:membrane dipeptidase [Kiritimatiellia bacterium]